MEQIALNDDRFLEFRHRRQAQSWFCTANHALRTKGKIGRMLKSEKCTTYDMEPTMKNLANGKPSYDGVLYLDSEMDQWLYHLLRHLFHPELLHENHLGRHRSLCPRPTYPRQPFSLQ